MATAASELEAENGGGGHFEEGQVGDLNETHDNDVQSFNYYLTKTSDVTRCTSTPQDGKVISTLASPPFQDSGFDSGFDLTAGTSSDDRSVNKGAIPKRTRSIITRSRLGS